MAARARSALQASPAVGSCASAEKSTSGEYAAVVPKRKGDRKHRKLKAVAAGVLFEALAMKARGYPLGGRIVVRCREGHLFTTLWIPGASVKSVRLVWWRIQRCPVGGHWTIVTPVRDSELTDDERREANERQDTWIP